MFSIIFLIETPKRVLPKDSHYFLLAPISPVKEGCWGIILEVFGRYVEGKTNQKAPKNNSKSFLLIFYKGAKNEFYLGILITSY